MVIVTEISYSSIYRCSKNTCTHACIQEYQVFNCQLYDRLQSVYIIHKNSIGLLYSPGPLIHEIILLCNLHKPYILYIYNIGYIRKTIYEIYVSLFLLKQLSTIHVTERRFFVLVHANCL